MKVFRNKLAIVVVSLAGYLGLVGGCGSTSAPVSAPKSGEAALAVESAAAAKPFRFTDITQAAGIRWTHNNGADGLKFPPETMGSGVAFLDYDGDGYQDIFLVNSRFWNDDERRQYQNGRWSAEELQFFQSQPHAGAPGDAKSGVKKWLPPRSMRHTRSALYHNNGNGTFSDVTARAGLDREFFGMGAAVGDYDNDGRPDLYVTAYPNNFLFHNQSTLARPHFKEVAAQAGVQDKGWSTSAAWVDVNRDGRLDLFVCHYLEWTPATDRFLSPDGHQKGYNGPSAYPPQPSRLYLNMGQGRFRDVSAMAGIQTSEGYKFEEMPDYVRQRGVEYFKASVQRGNVRRKLFGKSLGVLVCDYNQDGWPDLLVANDGTPNFLFTNKQDGTFREGAVKMGIALSDIGDARAGMGIDGGDIDGSGRESILIGNFAQEMLGLHQFEQGRFIDIAPSSEVGRASRAFLTFGCNLVDLNNDGWLDIVAANGPIPDYRSERMPGEMGLHQRPLLFRNVGRGQFREVGLQSGAAVRRPVIARGLAHADIDLDGDQDVVLTVNNGPSILLRNDSDEMGNALRVVLQGTRSNRSGLDATVEATVGTRKLLSRVRSGASYLSQSELPATLGLGGAKAASLLIRWPSGAVSKLPNVPANQMVTVDENKGLIRRQPLKRPQAGAKVL